MDKHLHILLTKYINNQLTIEEVTALKEKIGHIDDEELDASLMQLWSEYQGTGKSSGKVRRKIYGNLHNLLQPRRQMRFAMTLGRSVAAACICILLGFTIYLYVDRVQITQTLNSMYNVQVGKGERATVLLPDGTKVYLNAQSSLSYPASFGQQERRLRFTGEAYFDVVTNPEKPFIVDNPAMSVKVLGTVFNLYATASDDWFETALVEGSIEITLNMPVPRTEILSPNQKMRYNKRTGEWKIVRTDLWEETAWRRGDLIFRSKTFQEVISQLESYYGVAIHIQGKYPTSLFTATFHEDDINEVLLNLQQHYDFKYTKTGSEITIKLNY